MNDIDLEQEFQLLMRTVIKQIGEKVERGELTDLEAANLLQMVEDRMQPPVYSSAHAWSSSGCSEGSDDDGWSGSSQIC